jgi:hypothetical protein
MPPETIDLVLGGVHSGPLPSGTSLFAPPSGSETMMSMSLQGYHEICCWYLYRPRYWSVSLNDSVKLGSIRYSSEPEYERSLEVASTDCGIFDEGWSTADPIIRDYWHPYIIS